MDWVKNFDGSLFKIGRGKLRKTCLELELILFIVVEL